MRAGWQAVWLDLQRAMGKKRLTGLPSVHGKGRGCAALGGRHGLFIWTGG